MSKPPTNIPHSVHQRLMNLARSKGDDPNVMLMRYGIERLLYRIAQSEYSEQFVLKGAIACPEPAEGPSAPPHHNRNPNRNPNRMVLYQVISYVCVSATLVSSIRPCPSTLSGK